MFVFEAQLILKLYKSLHWKHATKFYTVNHTLYSVPKTFDEIQIRKKENNQLKTKGQPLQPLISSQEAKGFTYTMRGPVYPKTLAEHSGKQANSIQQEKLKK